MTVPHPTRQGFRDELEQLRLQVEVMGLLVDENLTRMGQVLRTANAELVGPALRADSEIDAMNVWLIERCYQLLILEAPVAGDLRLIVSVLRVTSELERRRPEPADHQARPRGTAAAFRQPDLGGAARPGGGVRAAVPHRDAVT